MPPSFGDHYLADTSSCIKRQQCKARWYSTQGLRWWVYSTNLAKSLLVDFPPETVKTTALARDLNTPFAWQTSIYSTMYTEKDQAVTSRSLTNDFTILQQLLTLTRVRSLQDSGKIPTSWLSVNHTFSMFCNNGSNTTCTLATGKELLKNLRSRESCLLGNNSKNLEESQRNGFHSVAEISAATTRELWHIAFHPWKFGNK